MNPSEIPSTVAQLLEWAHEATETIQELAARVEELERQRVPAKDRIVTYLRAFTPMRFTVSDVGEEVGIAVKSAGIYLAELAAAGRIGRVLDPDSGDGRFLYFAVEEAKAA